MQTKVCWSTYCTRTFHLRKPGLSELCLSPGNSNLKPCIWLLAWGTPLLCHRVPGRRGADKLLGRVWYDCHVQHRGWQCWLSFCQSHPDKLSLHSHCLSAKTVSQRWHELKQPTNKGPSVSYSTCQVRIESVIPQMVYGSETHPVTTLRQWIESITIRKNYTFLWRSKNMLPLVFIVDLLLDSRTLIKKWQNKVYFYQSPYEQTDK